MVAHPAASSVDVVLVARSVLWEGPMAFLPQLLASFWPPYLCERTRNSGVVKSYEGSDVQSRADVDHP